MMLSEMELIHWWASVFRELGGKVPAYVKGQAACDEHKTRIAGDTQLVVSAVVSPSFPCINSCIRLVITLSRFRSASVFFLFYGLLSSVSV